MAQQAEHNLDHVAPDNEGSRKSEPDWRAYCKCGWKTPEPMLYDDAWSSIADHVIALVPELQVIQMMERARRATLN